MVLLEVRDDLGDAREHSGQHSGKGQKRQVLIVTRFLRRYSIRAVEEGNRQHHEGNKDAEHVKEGLARLSLGKARNDRAVKRLHPIQHHEKHVLEENDDVFSVGGNGIALQVVVDDAREECNTLHVEGHRVQTGHVSAEDDLQDLGKLHDSRSDHNAIAEGLAYRVLQAGNIHQRPIDEECTVASVTNEVTDQLAHIPYV